MSSSIICGCDNSHRPTHQRKCFDDFRWTKKIHGNSNLIRKTKRPIKISNLARRLRADFETAWHFLRHLREHMRVSPPNRHPRVKKIRTVCWTIQGRPPKARNQSRKQKRIRQTGRFSLSTKSFCSTAGFIDHVHCDTHLQQAAELTVTSILICNDWKWRPCMIIL